MNIIFVVGRTRTANASAGLLAAIALFGGCAANLLGVGGETTFKCKAPDGVQCQSVSGTYANARAGNLPAQQTSGASAVATPSMTAVGYVPAPLVTASAVQSSWRLRDVAPFGAIRSDPTIIRIWIAPWEDADGDLMDQTYVYMPLDTGRWLIEHNRQRIKREFSPVRAPASVAATSPAVRSMAARPALDADGTSPDAAPDSAAALAAGIARLRGNGREEGAAGRSWTGTATPEAPQ